MYCLPSCNIDLKQLIGPYQNAKAACKFSEPNKKYKLNELGEISTIGSAATDAKKNNPEITRKANAILESWYETDSCTCSEALKTVYLNPLIREP